MKLISLFIKILILALLIALAAVNTHSVQFSWLPGNSVQWPLIAILLIFFAAGCLCGVLAMFGRLLSLRNENNRLRAEVRRNAQAILPTTDTSTDKTA